MKEKIEIVLHVDSEKIVYQEKTKITNDSFKINNFKISANSSVELINKFVNDKSNRNIRRSEKRKKNKQ